jgi:hypothetical protein
MVCNMNLSYIRNFHSGLFDYTLFNCCEQQMEVCPCVAKWCGPKFQHISRTWVQCVMISRFTPHGSVMQIAVILWRQTSEVAIVFILDLQIVGATTCLWRIVLSMVYQFCCTKRKANGWLSFIVGPPFFPLGAIIGHH